MLITLIKMNPTGRNVWTQRYTSGSAASGKFLVQPVNFIWSGQLLFSMKSVTMTWTDLHISNGSVNQVHRRANKINTRVLVQCVGKMIQRQISTNVLCSKQCESEFPISYHGVLWVLSYFLWCACEMHKRFKSPKIEALISASHIVMNVCFCWSISHTSSKSMEQNSSWETKNHSSICICHFHQCVQNSQRISKTSKIVDCCNFTLLWGIVSTSTNLKVRRSFHTVQTLQLNKFAAILHDLSDDRHLQAIIPLWQVR